MERMIQLLIPALLETLYMSTSATFFGVIFGTVLGVMLKITEKGFIASNPAVHRVLSYVVNIGRSFPFVILMIAIMPLTRAMVGSSIGTGAAVVPLSLATIPFFARVVESALGEIDFGLIEAAQSMGATNGEIIRKVLLPESISPLVLGITITFVNVVGYSAMAGVVGGGGLGDLAIRYGYHRFDQEVMFSTIIVLVVLVTTVQWTGSFLANKLNRRRS
ncbi:methionine ABC transporter permease [Isachenkonia alkalipeptolytica]|uniref:ABC transporter permease n=1 Tax=Isachenkonia alkalipeptolytica TaxID=2565777 RepID=A0AA43XN26_9CLOT|nr:methionine ABC transporter permease [Isachenkonia alkalipeptolytica]NBG89421.1 ABC transporter permease [Isachenkonia alkalipeptolytica]